MAERKEKKERRKRLQQLIPSIDYMQVSSQCEDVGKDFGTLINAPLSKGGHFIFKSEKEWSVDSSKYSEFFTINVKTLSAAIDCIPFNENVDVNNKYFTRDQLTSIYNDVEKGKEAYHTIIDSLNKSNSSNATCSENEANKEIDTNQLKRKGLSATKESHSQENLDDLEDDLEFLLSLTEPVPNNRPVIIPSISMPYDDSKSKPREAPTKSMDLEKWLDSVLND